MPIHLLTTFRQTAFGCASVDSLIVVGVIREVAPTWAR
jgi:hypothetical protein